MTGWARRRGVERGPGVARVRTAARLAAAGALALTLAVALSASAEEQAATGRFRTELSQCRARGGRPAHGPFGERYCRIRYPDAGRACTDSSQCLGGCVWGDDMWAHPPAQVVGACQSENVTYGCYFTVLKGRAVDPRCAD